MKNRLLRFEPNRINGRPETIQALTKAHTWNIVHVVHYWAIHNCECSCIIMNSPARDSAGFRTAWWRRDFCDRDSDLPRISTDTIFEATSCTARPWPCIRRYFKMHIYIQTKVKLLAKFCGIHMHILMLFQNLLHNREEELLFTVLRQICRFFLLLCQYSSTEWQQSSSDLLHWRFWMHGKLNFKMRKN